MNRLIAALTLAATLLPPWPARSARGEVPPAPAGISQARADYLQALTLAAEGSNPEALLLLAESLRLQPWGNPAAALAFELVTEARTNGGLRLRGHAGAVRYAAYSPDGNKIVTASADHTARLWDARTGRPLGPVLRHDDDVVMAEFSPDGMCVVTASEDKTARVWDATSGRPIGEVMRDGHEMRFARFSPDSRLVATGAGEGTGQIWDARTGQPIGPPIRYHGAVFNVNFSPDGATVVTANADGRSDVLQVDSGRPVVPSLRHANGVNTAVFSRDGTRILTASNDKTARVWDAQTGRALSPPLEHGHCVLSAAFDLNAARVVTASWDHTARVWDAATGQPLTPPLRHADAVYQAGFSPDGRFVTTASRDHTARVWDAATGDPLTPGLRVTAGEVGMTAFHPEGNSLLIASKDPVVAVRDLAPQTDPPAWLADLAEYASTRVEYDESRVPRLDVVKELSARLLASSHPEDPWEKFGRWFFLEAAERPISPWSSVSLREYVSGLASAGDRDSLDEAIALSQNVSSLLVKLVPQRLMLDAGASGRPAPAVVPPDDD